MKTKKIISLIILLGIVSIGIGITYYYIINNNQESDVEYNYIECTSVVTNEDYNSNIVEKLYYGDNNNLIKVDYINTIKYSSRDIYNKYVKELIIDEVSKYTYKKNQNTVIIKSSFETNSKEGILDIEQYKSNLTNMGYSCK